MNIFVCMMSMTSMFSLFVVVEALKQDWECSLCSNITTQKCMLQYDACDKWTHWYISQLYLNNIMPVPHFIFETQCIQPIFILLSI